MDDLPPLTKIHEPPVKLSNLNAIINSLATARDFSIEEIEVMGLSF